MPGFWRSQPNTPPDRGPADRGPEIDPGYQRPQSATGYSYYRRLCNQQDAAVLGGQAAAVPSHEQLTPYSNMPRFRRSHSDTPPDRGPEIGPEHKRSQSATDHYRRGYSLSASERDAAVLGGQATAVPSHEQLTPLPSVEGTGGFTADDRSQRTDEGYEDPRMRDIDEFITKGFGPPLPTERSTRHVVLDQLRAAGGDGEWRFFGYARRIRENASFINRYLCPQAHPHPVLENAKTAINGAVDAYLHVGDTTSFLDRMGNISGDLLPDRVTGPRYGGGYPGPAYEPPPVMWTGPIQTNFRGQGVPLQPPVMWTGPIQTNFRGQGAPLEGGWTRPVEQARGLPVTDPAPRYREGDPSSGSGPVPITVPPRHRRGGLGPGYESQPVGGAGGFPTNDRGPHERNRTEENRNNFRNEGFGSFTPEHLNLDNILTRVQAMGERREHAFLGRAYTLRIRDSVINKRPDIRAHPALDHAKYDIRKLVEAYRYNNQIEPFLNGLRDVIWGLDQFISNPSSGYKRVWPL